MNCTLKSARVVVALAAVSGLLPTGVLHAEPISVAGSSTVKPIIDKAVIDYKESHADAQFVVGAGGSGQGVKLAGSGDVQIGMASRGLKDDEKAKYPELVATKIGLDGIVFVVHASNPVKQITTAQVRDAFTGKITSWKDLGGSEAPVVLISTHEKHGTFDGFVEHLKLEAQGTGDGAARVLAFAPKGSGAFPPVTARAVDGNKEVLAAVLTQPNGLSYASLGAAAALVAKGAPIRVLDLDGVSPSEATVVNGKYSFQRSLFVLTKGEPQGAAAEFIRFLTAEPGQKVVKSLDFITLPAAQ